MSPRFRQCIDLDQAAGVAGRGGILVHADKGDEYARQQAQTQTDGDHASDLADDLTRRGIGAAFFHAQGDFRVLRMRRTKRTVGDVAHVALHRCDETANDMGYCPI